MTSEQKEPNLLVTTILAAMAGGMAWGIRGQYGHETGAMIAGVLVGLVVIVRFCPHFSSLQAARAVALMAIGVSFGGSMTYGQTVGLTHDGPLVGNAAALRWGLFGLFIKGAVWIGFAGALLGMGLSGKRYRPLEAGLLLVGCTLLLFVGVWLFNQPYDPANRQLPKIYFSDDWRWEPDSELKPRRERWGGILVALAGLFVYVSAFKRDALARQLTLWGLLGGGLGFSLGQCVQAANAWHPEWFNQGALSHFTQHVNWWNAMETTFGLIFGAVLAFGIWRNRHRLEASTTAEDLSLKPPVEIGLLVVHIAAVIVWNFLSVDALDAVADLAIPMGILPIIAVLGGRYAPYLMTLTVVAIPIAGKTVRELAYRNDVIPDVAGISVYIAMPIFVLTWAAVHFAIQRERTFAPLALMIAAWFYFGINWAFFRYPWPWEPWTGRTPHGLVFLICTICVTLAALRRLHRDRTVARAETA